MGTWCPPKIIKKRTYFGFLFSCILSAFVTATNYSGNSFFHVWFKQIFIVKLQIKTL